MGYNRHQAIMANCKKCGKEIPDTIYIKYGGYCCPACAAAGKQRERTR